MPDADETTPLFTKRPPPPSSSSSQCTDWLETASRRRPHGCREIFALCKDSVPVIFSYILQNSIQTVSVVVVGRLGAKELSVAAFSLMLAFVTGWCVALGGSTALDTLGSQAFTGGKRSTDLSVHFQRCLLLLWVLFVPVGIAWANMEPILLALGQERPLSHDTQQYLRWLLFAAPGYIAFESLKKYLQCQATYVLLIISPINFALNVYFVHHTHFGLMGSPISLSISFWLSFILLAIYAAYSPTHTRNQTWGGIQLRAVLHVRSCLTFLKLALPGILMVGTEWAAFEIVALAAARLGPTSLAAQSVIMTTDQILNTIPFGIGVAASTRVGNAIGRRDASGAKFVSHISALLSVAAGSGVMLVLMCAKDMYGYIFSDDERVVQLVSQVMPLVASFQIADGLAGSCGGVLRGQGWFPACSLNRELTLRLTGRQHLGALFNLIAYYILALPLGLSLAFNSHYGLRGLWIGQVVALFIIGLGEYGVVLLGTDWEEEVRKGCERNNQELCVRGCDVSV
ncbi:MOP flippase [Artomyces pyxidatus]|uniref:MOP flippase n=1 Tax=Artomyces pyxidatus TaxID=48021 RepID=A0ACB8T193_9AGAM|nr:MOP flippase [Artomyces pyxidatus]